jgi:hypothetical protein
MKAARGLVELAAPVYSGYLGVVAEGTCPVDDEAGGVALWEDEGTGTMTVVDASGIGTDSVTTGGGGA